ncbi:hypothetical protein I4U23_007498 [Adineta vaga]|nr:hypothetical protein I4U23_007498 [Adineta vaga]
MSTTNHIEKNDKYAEELAELNKIFANRYQETDDEFRKMTQRSFSPPIMDDWTWDRNPERTSRFNNDNQQGHYTNFHRGRRNHSNYDYHNHPHPPYNARNDRKRSRSPRHRDLP